MDRPKLEGLTKQQVEYIIWLEKIIQGATKLQVALSETCDKIADELKIINSGSFEGLTILNSEEKYFERINLMVKNRSDWSDLVIGKTEETETKTVITKKKLNVQDFVIKQK